MRAERSVVEHLEVTPQPLACGFFQGSGRLSGCRAFGFVGFPRFVKFFRAYRALGFGHYGFAVWV